MTYKMNRRAGPIISGYGYGSLWEQQQLPGFAEEIETFSHNIRALGQGDIGGPFWLKRDNWAFNPPIVSGGWASGTQLGISSGLSTNPYFAEPESSDMITQGATAISRSIPTTPSFSALNSMSELMRDGVPSAIGVQTWKARTNVARGAGSEYLNVEFGWLPLVNDIRTFAKTVKNHHQILSDLKAGSGKVTRTGYAFPSSSNVSSATGGAYTYFPNNSGISTAAGANYTAISESRTWFKGAFTYHLPVSDGQVGKAQYYAELADKLLGIKPTPAAIWNATPWSWGLDWFTNAGDIMTNISELGQNGLVLRYGYIMSHSRVEEIIVVAGQPGGWSGNVSAGQVSHLREFKKRLPSTPYGFGVTGDELTHAQQAVIVALGLSHGHGGHG